MFTRAQISKKYVSWWPVHLSLLSWGFHFTSSPHNNISKPLATFPHSHSRYNGQQGEKEMNVVINISWRELFNFQNSFNCHLLELLRTAPLPIHKVIIIAIF